MYCRIQKGLTACIVGRDNHHICIDIEGENPSHSRVCFPCQIYKVHYPLRRINELEYEPVALSIGPYHHRTKERLEDMDKCKELYLQSMLDRIRRNQQPTEMTSQRGLEEEMKNKEEQVRACYASSFRPIESEEFIRMLVLDGCFIIELFRKMMYKNLKDMGKDSIFKIEFIIHLLFRDLVLFENQPPLFVLQKLFELTKGPEDSIGSFHDLALSVLLQVLGERSSTQDSYRKYQDSVPHLLGLAYLIYASPFPEMSSDNRRYDGDIQSTVALREAGVKFKIIKAENNHGFGAIKFNDNGILELPHMNIEDNTESLLRNFIAFEQYSAGSSLHCVTDFCILMDCLINTSKDAEVLRHAGIITNGLGDDETVTRMFNQLTASVSFNDTNFFYTEEFKRLNRYCARKKNVWMAKLRHGYFNSPWSLLSFLAALALLGLTLVQTVFSVLSYTNPRS